MAKVAFLGLGVMGYPMAGHLVSAGHSVTVYNRSGAKAASWSEQHKGGHQPTPREAAAGQAIVFACVGNDDDLRSVCLCENGAFAGMDEGALFVDHTTVSPTVTRELAQVAAAQGLRYVDAPISGGQAGAENGVLTVMCGGAQADFDEAFPVIDAYAKKCMLIGPVGAGQQTKMLNQICIAG
ncbi:MAG: NAD(P)-dependent oxidoreductase, partial [Pseudomonadota bacterium]|nr:NAD(P)-dependent oxidoreductase [Pseudomonadota bacterium]